MTLVYFQIAAKIYLSDLVCDKNTQFSEVVLFFENILMKRKYEVFVEQRFSKNSRPFKCNDCPFSAKFESHLISHRSIHSGVLFRCYFKGCNYCSTKKSLLAFHNRRHTPSGKSHQCPDCNRSFQSKSNLLRHRKNHLADTVLFYVLLKNMRILIKWMKSSHSNAINVVTNQLETTISTITSIKITGAKTNIFDKNAYKTQRALMLQLRLNFSIQCKTQVPSHNKRQWRM